MNQLAITGTTTRRRSGRTLAALEATMRAWNAADTLAGPEHAAARASLRDAAEAVDVARAALHAAQHAGMASASQADDVSRCANRLGESARRLLDMVRLVADKETTADGFDEFLASLSGPTVRD